MKYLLFLAITLLAACSSGGSSDTSSSGAGGTSGGGTGSATQIGGPVIDNEDLSAGLKGIDADNNGIRDDIDRLITKKYALTPAMKKAAEQKAKSLQQIMESTTKFQARLAANENGRASDCIFKLFKSDAEWELKKQMSKEFESLTANTRERFIAYMNANKLMGGMVFSQAEEPVCD